MTAGSPAITAVLFDVDDTLVDFTGAANAALLEAVRTHLHPGLDDAAVPDDAAVLAAWAVVAQREYDRYTSGELSFDDMRVTRTRAFVDELAARIGDGSPPPADPQVHVRIEAHRTGRIFDHYRLFDDVLPELRRLQDAGLRVGVISNSDGDYSRRKLATVGLAGFFDACIFSGDLGVAKPDPTIFLAGVTALGATPGRTAYVGDRWDVDALGSAAAGLLPVWLDRDGHGGRPDAEDRAGAAGEVAVARIGRLSELADVLSEPAGASARWNARQGADQRISG